MRSRILSVRSGTLLVCSGLVAVVLLAGALVWLLRANAAAADDARARHELRESAGTVVAHVFSVGQDTWQADRARARGLVGGRFAENHATELTRPPADGVRRVLWRPDVVGVIDADAAHGDVVIRATVTTTPASGPDVVEKRSVTAQFERVGERWVLGDLEVLQ
ncbi:hypothetical protein ACWDTI_19965 [Gordonia sp. NPDC003424]